MSSLLRQWGPFPLLVAWLTACGVSMDNEQSLCKSNEDCPTGQICYEDGCGSAAEFAVRVTPLRDEARVPQDFSSVSVAAGELTLVMKEPGLLRGDLLIKRDAAIEPYRAVDSSPETAFTVLARGRSSKIPGLAFPQSISQTVKNGSELKLAVPAGIWDVSVTVADPGLPPVFAEATVASKQEIDPSLILASGTNLVTIESFVIKDPGMAWPATSPLFRIQALDPLMGTPLSQASVFSAPEQFRLNALRVSGKTRLRLSPAPDSPAPAPVKEFESDAQGRFELPLVIGDYGEPVEVAGIVLSPGATPIANAEVRAEGKVRGGGTFTASTRTNAGGGFSLKLLPTEPALDSSTEPLYSITVTPPPTSAYASTTIKTAVSQALTLEPVICSHKVSLSGAVYGPSSGGSKPLAGVAILFEGNPSSLDPGLSQGDTTTDHDGAFSVLVEPGSYRIMAKPTSEQRLAWASRRVHTSEGEITLALSEAREVRGTITDWQGKTVANATVTFYRTPISAAGADDLASPPVVVETLTDSAGAFRALVPKAESGDEHE